jgi:acyl-CoA thioester hydrolase
VRYNECDAQGVVFNANYFAYFDVVLTEVWREAFGSYGAMVEAGTDVVVAEARARFLDAARFDDEIELRWWIERLGTTAMSVRVDIAARRCRSAGGPDALRVRGGRDGRAQADP